MKKLLTAVVALVVLILIGGGMWTWLNTSSDGPSTSSSGPRKPGQPQEPDWCPAVQVISAPGTWESAPDDDAFNPQANPHSFMLRVTQPLQQAYDINEVRVWTLPYTAQFRNIHANHEMSYDDSREEGMAKVNGELKHIGETCPSTEFILTGFSQGAVILGDIANEIGTGQGVIEPERVRGVGLVADGRRRNGEGNNPGVQLNGVGAEIALKPVNGLIQFVTPGATMRGPREGGFGQLEDKTWQICAPDDTICDAPLSVENAVYRAEQLIAADGVHALYASNPNVIEGTTADQWLVNWAHELIAQPARQ